MDVPGSWTGRAQYDAYAGRWSRRLAPRLLCWLTPQPGLRWLDVGCGTGALSAKSCSWPRPPPFVASTPRRQLCRTPLTPFPTRGRLRPRRGHAADPPVLDAAVARDPAAGNRDEAVRFRWPVRKRYGSCSPGPS
jgi:hypothetical protein